MLICYLFLIINELVKTIMYESKILLFITLRVLPAGFVVGSIS